MKKPLVSLTIAAVALTSLSGVAYAAVQSVEDQPAPQIIIPAAHVSSTDDHGGHDRGAASTTASTTVDDHGVDGSPRAGDDGFGHDATDDHGGRRGSGS